MNIIIFGASGLTGHELVKQALQQGHHVTAFVRTPAKLDIKHNNLFIFKGNVFDYKAVEDAVRGNDAVLCALGASTPFKRDPILVEGVRNIIDAMKQSGAQRLIYLSFIGVRESRKGLGFFINYFLVPLLKNVIIDHEEKEKLIKESHVNWTIVRPPKLTNGKHTGIYRFGEHVQPNSLILFISRADLADFMLRQLNDNSFIRKAVSVMY